MIVIALVALLMTLSIGSFRFFNRWLVRLQLNHLYMLCLCTRCQAMALRRTLHIQCNSSTNTYASVHQQYHLRKAIFNYLPGTMGPPSNPVYPITQPITFAQDTITFYPDGTMNAGTIYITDQDQTSMYALTIGVTEFPFIRTYLYANQWQLLT